MDQILNKENTGINCKLNQVRLPFVLVITQPFIIAVPANPIKNGVPTNSVLKKPLGKLDNVMHQTPGITPFKSTSLKLEGSIAKLSLRKAPKQNAVSKDREEVRYKTNSCFLGAYVLNCEYRVVNLFNYTDFPNEKCLKNCSKRKYR